MVSKKSTQEKHTGDADHHHETRHRGDCYAALKKRYSLPDMRLLEQEFDLVHLDEEQYPIREAIKKIADRLEWSCLFLESLMQPEHTAAFMEVEAFSEKQKKDILILYKRLMSNARACHLELLSADEQGNALFLNSFMKEWPSLKKQFYDLLKTAKDSWSSSQPHDFEAKLSGKQGYFG